MAAAKEIPEQYRWANNLKVGDVVFVNQGFRSDLSIATVSKVTKTSIIVGNNNQSYPRATLRHRIDAWTGFYLEQATPELEARYQMQQARRKIESLAHKIYNEKTKRSTLEVMTIEELQHVQIAMEGVCGLLDEVAKRVKP